MSLQVRELDRKAPYSPSTLRASPPEPQTLGLSTLAFSPRFLAVGPASPSPAVGDAGAGSVRAAPLPRDLPGGSGVREASRTVPLFDL